MKSLSKAKLSDLVIWGTREAHNIPKTSRAMVPRGLPQNPNGQPTSWKELSSHREEVMLLPEPAPARGQPFPSFLSSRLCGCIPPKFSPLPPGSMETPSPGPRRRRLSREKGAANARGPRASTAVVHSEARERARDPLRAAWRHPGALPPPSFPPPRRGRASA